MYKAEDIKNLREKTGAGMLDCKKALDATEGNIDKAIDWLREKGISKAEKKAGRVAAEGVCFAKTESNNAAILELNSETDFVASNKEFTDFANYLLDIILENDVKTVDDVLKVKDGNETVKDKLVALIAKIGENISLRRIAKIEKKDNEVFGSYIHMGGTIATLVLLEGNNETVAKDVAMQAAAMSPICVYPEEVPEADVNHEKEVIKGEIENDPKNASKPADIIEKMSIGRLNKFYKEVCLAKQEFIKDSSMSVEEYVKKNNSKIISMVRFVRGEGIEKKEENFAEEVMNQIKG